MKAEKSTPTKELARKLVRFLVIGSTVVSFLIITPIFWVALTDPKASLPTPLMVVWGVLVIAPRTEGSYEVIFEARAFDNGTEPLVRFATALRRASVR